MNQFALTVVSAPHLLRHLAVGTHLNRDIQYPDGLASRVTDNVKRPSGGSRMLTACPSPTPFGLGLGPTHPGRINLPQEPLGFRRLRFSRSISLLIPAFSLPPRPAPLVERPSSYYGTLPYHDPDAFASGPSTALVARLSPDHCRRRIARPVSCYALFK